MVQDHKIGIRGCGELAKEIFISFINCIVDNGQRDSEGGGAFIKGQCLCQLCVVVSIYIMGKGQIKYLKHEAYVSGST